MHNRIRNGANLERQGRFWCGICNLAYEGRASAMQAICYDLVNTSPDLCVQNILPSGKMFSFFETSSKEKTMVASTKVVWRKGERVNLRSILKEDIPRLLEWFNDEETTRFLNRVTPLTPGTEERWLEQMDKEFETPTPRNIPLAVTLTDGTLIGTIGLHGVDWINRNAVTGTTVGSTEHRQSGYATEAKMLLLEYAFDRLGLHKIYSHVLAFNEASLAYAKRCGYVEEGRFKQHHFSDGAWHDEVVLAVYRDAWEAAHKTWRADQTKRKTSAKP